ncbi:MAG: nicotinamide mononucleotide transporter [Bacteroidales bacterium]|nr:nicotinamide mononucleotide transporter [Bacteroidales bacterium]
MDTSTLIEYIGVAIGFVYLILEYKASFWLWTAGIIMSLFYIVIFYQSKFYADAGIYAYYLGANLYGIFEWKRHSRAGNGEDDKVEMPITHTPKSKILPLTLIGIAIWAALWFLLSRLTDSPVPFGDSFTTALSVVAMYLLAKKHIEHWWLWVVVNLVSTALYAWKGLYAMTGFFAFYTLIAAMGYFKWRKEMRGQATAEI